MKTLYKSLFRGWVEINQEQEQKLRDHMTKGITAMHGAKKQAYINSRFHTIAE